MNLIPAIIQDEKTKEVLMLGYMNKQALQKTKETGFVYLWSRKRRKLWKKGETSGNILDVKSVSIDCDKDTLLIKVNAREKTVCHKGTKTCFTNV